MEDRRSQIKKVAHDKRKKLALTVGLLIGLNHAPNLAAETNNNVLNLNNSGPHAVTHLAANRTGTGKIRIGTSSLKSSRVQKNLYQRIIKCNESMAYDEITCDEPETLKVEQALEILRNHLNGKMNSSVNDKFIEQLAHYYARYPKVMTLLIALDEYDWSLHIKSSAFQARASIKESKVDHVEVYFDPGYSARMFNARDCDSNPACTVTAADALIHELLHAWLMLKDPHEYARQNLHALYPVQHEHDVIALENEIYRDMSRIDQLPRPIRAKHQASLVAVNCPVCL